jgi:hypothetical protein
MTMPEMQAAITNAGKYIDILAFDCCNMAAIEVVYQASLTGLVGMLVGSEETIPMNGFPYDLMLIPVALDPSRTREQVAVDMVEGWAQYYDPLSWATTVNLAAVNVTMISGSIGTVQTWCAKMYADLALYKKSYKTDVSNSYIAWATYYHVDLADLCDKIVADATIKDATLKTASTNLAILIDAAVLDVQSGSGADAARGMTLYWRVRSDWKTYSVAYHEVAFAIDMNWYNFLVAYNA